MVGSDDNANADDDESLADIDGDDDEHVENADVENQVVVGDYANDDDDENTVVVDGNMLMRTQ